MYPISESTLARLASQGRGPVFHKPTDKVLYKPQDVEQWIEAAPMPARQTDGVVAGHTTGRGKKSRSILTTPASPPARDAVPPTTGRRLKSLTPSSDSWLLRNE